MRQYLFTDIGLPVINHMRPISMFIGGFESRFQTKRAFLFLYFWFPKFHWNRIADSMRALKSIYNL